MTGIAHDAIVRQIDGDSVTVVLLNHENCAGCHAEKACGISSGESKTVLITGKYNVKPGDRVTVTMKQSDGFMALFLGYLLPLIVFLFSLILLNAFSANELLSGLISLGILVPYYLLFSLFRKSMNTRFSFHIKM
jgi:positive regulator of sigma E activity